MKIPNKRFNKLILIIHQISTFKVLRIFIKNGLENHFFFFLIIDITLESYNSSRSRKNLLERVQKLITTISDNIIDQKIQNTI